MNLKKNYYFYFYSLQFAFHYDMIYEIGENYV